MHTNCRSEVDARKLFALFYTKLVSISLRELLTTRIFQLARKRVLNTVTVAYCQQAILELHWSPNNHTIVTASADKTLGYWDAHVGKRKKTFKVRETWRVALEIWRTARRTQQTVQYRI